MSAREPTDTPLPRPRPSIWPSPSTQSPRSCNSPPSGRKSSHPALKLQNQSYAGYGDLSRLAPARNELGRPRCVSSPPPGARLAQGPAEVHEASDRRLLETFEAG
jgi:hypothetical protein